MDIIMVYGLRKEVDMIPAVYLSNKGGIPRVQSNSVNVANNVVTFSIVSNRLFANTYNGLILFKLSQTIPTTATSTDTISFTSDAGTIPVTVLGGGNYTVANYETGIHLAYYESNTNTLQILI